MKEKYIVILNTGDLNSRQNLQNQLNNGYSIFKKIKFKDGNDTYYHIILRNDRIAKLDKIVEE